MASWQVYNLVLAGIIGAAVVVGIVVYFLLLNRQLRNLQSTILFEIERLKDIVSHLANRGQ